MADTTALKNRIRAAIKSNDNQEITGPVLQQTLLDIVDELDTTELAAEINARKSADTQLQQNINAETTRAEGAEHANASKLGYYVCDTPAATAAKAISATSYVLSLGGSIKIKMTNANTVANATLNINSTGAKPLYYDGERASANNSWEAGETVEVYYDGTSFYANNVAGGGGKAEKIKYDNTNSGLAAENVQGALDEICEDLTIYDDDVKEDLLTCGASNARFYAPLTSGKVYKIVIERVSGSNNIGVYAYQSSSSIEGNTHVDIGNLLSTENSKEFIWVCNGYQYIGIYSGGSSATAKISIYAGNMKLSDKIANIPTTVNIFTDITQVTLYGQQGININMNIAVNDIFEVSVSGSGGVQSYSITTWSERDKGGTILESFYNITSPHKIITIGTAAKCLRIFNNGGPGESFVVTVTKVAKMSINDAFAYIFGNLSIIPSNASKLGYYVCDTPAATAAKTVDATDYVLTAGGSMKIKMANANTADNATLNINSTGAKALYYDGKRASANNSWEAGETVEVYYDGTSFYANNVAGGGGKAGKAEKIKYDNSQSGLAVENVQEALDKIVANLSIIPSRKTAPSVLSDGMIWLEVGDGMVVHIVSDSVTDTSSTFIDELDNTIVCSSISKDEDYLSLSNQDSMLRLPDIVLSEAFSIFMKFKLKNNTQTSCYMALFNYNAEAQSQVAFIYNYNNTSSMLQLYVDGMASNSITLSDTNVHELFMKYKNGVTIVYLDGEKVQVFTQTLKRPTSAMNLIGNSYSKSHPCAMDLKEFRLYNKAVNIEDLDL